jgi:hypothetical protein
MTRHVFDVRVAGHFVLAALVLAGLVLTALAAPLHAANPYIKLGPADEIALDQPRIAVQLRDPDTGRLLGPFTANTFLLDTGANSILAVDDSVFELNANGYQTEGRYLEQGVAGFTEYDVSAKYDFEFAGSDGVIHSIPGGRMMSSNTDSFCPIPGFCSFFGIMGMPAMDGRVTTMDLRTLVSEDSNIDLDNIFAGNFNAGFLSTTFSQELPETDRRRYHVPLQAVHFEQKGDGPFPSWSDLPFVHIEGRHDGNKSRGNFVLDTGAQLSIISSAMAFELGLDANNNGTFADEAVGFQQIGGVGGTKNVPLMLFEELRIPTAEGVDLVYENIQVAILDIDPVIDGIFGMNFMSSGWTGRLFGGLGDLLDLLDEAGLADLLGDLDGLGVGGLGIGNEGALTPAFEQVHFDFRGWDKGQGSMVFDLMDGIPGVLAHDGTHGDLDGDLDVDLDDRIIWVRDVMQTTFGDSNLDGAFDSKDLVAVFSAGEYDDDVPMNSTWYTGDWNMDAEFNSKDLVLAFQMGGYQSATATAAVPEPSGLLLLAAGALGLVLSKRQRAA